MLTLTRTGAQFSGSERELSELARQFDSRHFVKLPGIIDPSLYRALLDRIERADFEPISHDRIDGSEFTMRDRATANLLSFLMNGTRLFRVIERLTGCPRIGSFHGRVYRLAPNTRQQLHWHDDFIDHRLIALSLNLSAGAYAGGCFQLRHIGTDAPFAEVPNTEPNSAILFRVSEQLEHRVTAVEGDLSKTAYSGWFSSQPDMHSRLVQAIEQ